MNEKTRFRLKSFKRYLPHIFAGIAALGGMGLAIGLVPASESETKALNKFYSSDEVYKAAQTQLDEQYHHGFINQKEYNKKINELKKKTAEEYYKTTKSFKHY